MARDPFEALPVNAVTRILELLSTADLYSRVSLVCKAWQCLANAAQRDTKLDVTLSSSAAGHSFAAWLSQQDGTLVRLSIHGGPLVILSPRTAMWAALSAAAQQPSGNRAGGCSSSRYRACSSTERAVGVGSASGHSSNTSRSGLQGLDVSVPLSSADEVMLLGCVARQVRSLHMLHLNYTQPSQQLCFETTAAGAALKSATQLQSLSILGAALDSSVPALARLTQLTLLAFTASGAPGLPGVLSRLVLLRHLALTSQARPGAAREGFTAALSTSIAKCSSLTTLQLVGFKATDSSNGLLSRIASLVQLQSLDLAGCLFHVQQLLPVSACTLLTSISFASNDLGGSSGSSILAQLTLPILQLRALDISGCRAQLQPLYGLTGLTSVHAGAHRFRFHPNLVATADLFGISALKQNLQALDLSCNKLDCSSLQHLAHLLGLTALNLAENDLSFEETTCEERAREVQRGACSCNAIHESTEGRNSSQRNCSSNNACVLHCNSCSKHPSGLQHLAGMRKLQQLDLSSCSLEDVTPLAHLRGSLTQLKLGFSGVWRHSYNQLLPGSFIALASLTGLQHLGLHYCRGQHTRLPIEASALGRLGQLTHLDVSGCWDACWQISREDNRLPKLKELFMLLQDHAALGHIAACCSALETLHMSDVGQTMHGSVTTVAPLSMLSGLTSLSISSLEALPCVAELVQLSGLRHLRLFSSQGLEDGQAVVLTGMTHLTCLDLRHSGVCAHAVRQLGKALQDTWVWCE